MLITPIDSFRYRAFAFGSLFIAAVLLALYLASYFLLMKLNHPAFPPLAATPITIVHYWQQYGADPYTAFWLTICLTAGVLPAAIGFFYVVRPVSRSLHGDARFATLREVKRADLFLSAGIVLGRWGWRILVLGRQLGAIVIAPPRSGKGAGLVQPNALSWLGSLVVNDARKECHRITAGWRRQFSQVYLFDPLSPTGKTAQCNPISCLYIPDDPALRVDRLQKLANDLSPDPASGDVFWPASCRDLFLGIGLYVVGTADITPGFPRTMGEMVRQVMYGADDSVSAHWKRVIAERDKAGKPLSDKCKQMLYDFITLSPQTQSSVRKTFTAKLQLWTNPLIDNATSGDSFDLRELRRKRITIYLGVQPGDLGRLSLLMNLFFTMLLGTNMDKMPEEDDSIRHELLVIADEFAAMGRMPIIENSIQLMGGYGIRLLLIAHSLSQLRAIYGPEHTANIIACSGARIVYAPNDSAFATDISRELGTFTTESKSTSRPAHGLHGGSVTTSRAPRALLDPTEVKLMGSNKQIVFMEHVRPIACEKIWYWLSPFFFSRANRPVPDVPAVPIIVPPGPVLAVPDETTGKARTARAITPKDVPKLGKLQLTDYAVNFDDIQLPKGEKLTGEDLDNAFDAFLSAIPN